MGRQGRKISTTDGRAQDKIQKDKGHQVKEGTDGAEKSHELLQPFSRPFQGPGEQAVIYMIPWKNQAQGVVKQIQ